MGERREGWEERGWSEGRDGVGGGRGGNIMFIRSRVVLMTSGCQMCAEQSADRDFICAITSWMCCHIDTSVCHLFACIHYLAVIAQWHLINIASSPALSLAMSRDGSSGGVIRIACIEKDGVERTVYTGKDIPQFYTK